MQKISIIFISILLWSGFPAKQTSEKNWPDELNTAKNSAYLTDLEQQVILELNKVRSNPKRFAEEYLEELRTAYSGKLYTYPGQNPVKTQEGIRPLQECIQVLKQTVPMPILKPAEGLVKAAAELATDQQKNGGIGHITRNGSTPQRRIEKYGEWDICSAEDITYGSFEARQIVIALLIDDGVPDRSHRKNILNPCFHFAGVANGSHPEYQTMCAIDYAGAYRTK
ncbi:MAG: CAP domain-containing protein [Bacteroidota bacterium]|nr:CAP domain-containing protein [Odoribacter sp.]MDP3642168.1 CAP domain-containing protein [Bacteroidota bacterium]